jgi:FimV-like protein
MPDKTDDLKDTRPTRIVKRNSPEQEKWELAQTYMKSSDLDNARKVLTELRGNANPYTSKATKLLKEIGE